MTQQNLLKQVIKQHTKKAKGVTLRTLSIALNASKDTLRKQISNLRKTGEWIVDDTTTNEFGRAIKTYRYTKQPQTYFHWRVKQLSRVEVKRGAPKYN